MHPPFTSDVFFPIQPWQANYFDVLNHLNDPDNGVTWLSLTPGQFLPDRNTLEDGSGD